jgi:hypothetical protein
MKIIGNVNNTSPKNEPFQRRTSVKNKKSCNISVEFLFFALNPARGVKCITGGEAKRNRRSRNTSIFPKPCKGN